MSDLDWTEVTAFKLLQYLRNPAMDKDEHRQNIASIIRETSNLVIQPLVGGCILANEMLSEFYKAGVFEGVIVGEEEMKFKASLRSLEALIKMHKL